MIKSERPGYVAEEDIDALPEHVVVDQCLAAIWHMHHAGAGHVHEHVGGKVGSVAGALAAIDELAGIRICVCNQLADRIHRQPFAHDHEIGH